MTLGEETIVVGTFENCTTKKEGDVVIRFKFAYTEIANYSKTLLMIGKKIKAMVKTEDGTKSKLGSFCFKQLSIDGEGEAKLSLEGELSAIDQSVISDMISQLVVLKLKVDANVE